ncbi:endonuclease VII domain-containing protein [Streptomyces sp. 5-8]|uniref:Endonuclease VII domain-containing protein n=1 Tax=Streptomyces musisoli TaxID=2802280 RepID=A0ABS1PAJ6_9ACTN|nr:endonuclease VII domain-containing protein [Streptomyces musisoli]MBL1109388.1 endonuclease VII domain-containing protein [Streptomyces musisoli]
MQRQSHIPVQSERTCKECSRPYKPLRDRMCQPCYKRSRKYGAAEYRREEVEEITLPWVRAKCARAGECLEWNGTVNKEGRPQTSDRLAWREGKSRQIALHRWVYEQSTGRTLSKGQHVRQTCGNKKCLAPEHLAASMPRPGRTPLGEAGRYQGKRKREDHLERCANGHKRTEENTYRTAHGHLVCRVCPSESRAARQGKDPAEHAWKPRKGWEDTPKCVNGHLFDEVGWYFNGEARVCRRCFAEKERRRWLRVNYSMELEDFEALLVAQDLACAICARLFDPDLLVPCVDHSHETGKVRGLLCHPCNLGIGHFEDDVSRLRSAAQYLDSKVALEE